MDFLSLLEAVELEEASAPINFTCKPRATADEDNEPSETDEDEDIVLSSLSNLRRLFHQRLPQWRSDVLALLEEAGSELEISSSLVAKLHSRLTELVAQLKQQFPGWCEHSEEIKLVSLVRS